MSYLISGVVQWWAKKKKQFGKGSNLRPERRDKKERRKKCYKMKGTKIKANRNENENGADMRQE